jgi:PKHD-type hydroxylase
MTQHLPIWYFGNIDPERCDQLIEENKTQAISKAAMGVDGEKLDDQYRSTSLVFLPFNHSLSYNMMAFALQANQECKWDYEINGRESIQFAKYETNQHYNWHTDTFTLSGKDTDRKLTAVLLLNDPSEFEGGEFQVKLYSPYTAPLQKGSIIVFPSILEHRVTPVTSGVRYSATMWFHGPRFR